jgi:hypothetical protein
MSQKSKGIGLMIALGKPSAPPPRYKATPDEQETPRPAPSEKGGDPAPPRDAGRPERNVAPEGAEIPEAQEGMGDMMSDMMAPLRDLGVSDADARSVLAKMFSAMAKCMGGGSPVAEHDAGGMEFEGGE